MTQGTVNEELEEAWENITNNGDDNSTDKDINRRELIKSIGPLTFLSWFSIPSHSSRPRTIKKGIEELEKSVKKDRTLRKKGHAKKIFLGNVNNYNFEMYYPLATTYMDFNQEPNIGSSQKKREISIEEFTDIVGNISFENGEPVNVGNKETDFLPNSNYETHGLIRGKNLELHFVYLEEPGYGLDIEGLTESSIESLKKLLPEEFDLDYRLTTKEASREDLNLLDESLKDENQNEFPEILLDKYSKNSREIPVFLLERELNEVDGRDIGGYAEYSQQAVVELSENNPEYNKHVVPHEIGHAGLMLPHNFHRNGVMSYNSESNRFNQRSQMLLDRLMSSKVQINPGTWEGRSDYINWGFIPGKIDQEAAREEMVSHLNTYIEDRLGYEIENWESKSVQEIETEEGPASKIKYERWDYNGQLELTINEYIRNIELI